MNHGKDTRAYKNFTEENLNTRHKRKKVGEGTQDRGHFGSQPLSKPLLGGKCAGLQKSPEGGLVVLARMAHGSVLPRDTRGTQKDRRKCV